MLKKFVTASAFCALATPAHALSMMGLHGPIMDNMHNSSIAVLLLSVSALAGVLTFRLARR